MLLMVCACFPPEPVVAATLTHDLATQLSARQNVRVVTPKPSRPRGFKFENIPAQTKNFEQIIVPSFTCSQASFWGRIKESYSFGKHVSRYIRKHRKEIHFIYLCSWPLLAPLFILKTAKSCSIPVIVHVEDIYPEAYTVKIPVLGKLVKNILLPVDAFILKKASKVIAVSENMKKYIMETRGVASEKIVLIPNWQNEDEFIRFHEQNQSTTEKQGPFTFMYLGNIGPLAGIDFVIKCFDQAGLKDARLVIAGSGAMKKKYAELAETCKNSTIEFWDVPAGKVPEIQSFADVMILPVIQGGAMSSVPSKLPAYMFSKKPVIACVDMHSDSARAVWDSHCGWIVPPGNSGRLVQLFQEVAGMSKAELQNLGENGFNYAMENYSKKRNLRELVNLISETATTDFHALATSSAG